MLPSASLRPSIDETNPAGSSSVCRRARVSSLHRIAVASEIGKAAVLLAGSPFMQTANGPETTPLEQT